MSIKIISVYIKTYNVNERRYKKVSSYFYLKGGFMNKEDKVYVPKNVKKNFEFFRGFGVKELIITLIVGIISIAPTIFLYKYVNQALALTLFLIIVATTIMLVIKDDNNISFLQQLKLVCKSIFMQKNFKYGKRDKR